MIIPTCTKYSYRKTELSLDTSRTQEFLSEAVDIGRRGLRGQSLLVLFVQKLEFFDFYNLKSDFSTSLAGT